MQGTDMRLRYISYNLADSRVIDERERSESVICSSGGQIRTMKEMCESMQ
jgi:hypothetical protein